MPNMHALALSNKCQCRKHVCPQSERVGVSSDRCMRAQAEWVKQLWWHPDREAWVPPVPIGPLALPPDVLADALDAGWWYRRFGGRACS